MKKDLLVITGAGQGIGEYLSINLSKKFFVFLISKSSNCEKISNQINETYPLSSDFLRIDFEKKINFKLLKKKIDLNSFKNINLIFCAGYLDNYSEELDITEWKKVFNINVFSHLEIFNYFLPLMKKNKFNNKIIFFSGGGAANSFDTFPAYSASKTAIVRIVENLALRYEKYNISIFAIAPGSIKTKMLEKVLQKTDVGTKTSKKEILKFIEYYLKIDSFELNGMLVHVRDDKEKIKKNKNMNYLKLRRVE